MILINKDDLLDHVKYMSEIKTDQLKEVIDRLPIVEIVRCKDCKHAYKRKPTNKTAVLCELFGAGMKDNDFCSCGERSKE